MKKFKQISQIGLMTTLIGVAAFAQAADGTVGVGINAQSQGSMALQVNVPQMVVIKSVPTPAAVDFDGTTDANFSGDLCVGTNTAGYSIQASSQTSTTSGATTFTLTDGATPTPHTVDYTVAWSTTIGATTGGTPFTYSGAILNYGGGPVSNIGCASNNASVVVIVPASKLQLAPAGTYQDTLLLLAKPL